MISTKYYTILVIEIDIKTAPNFIKEGTYANIVLTREGSPFLPDADLDTGDNTYYVFVTNDGPLAMINAGYVNTGGSVNVRELIAARDEMPEKLHFLTDEECKIFLSALEQSAAYIIATSMELMARDKDDYGFEKSDSDASI